MTGSRYSHRTDRTTLCFSFNMSTMKIAFLGLGIMGSRMASHLLAAYPGLTVWNRSPEPAVALAEAGAVVASSAKEAVRGADLVLTMLASPKAVDQVMLGEEGVLSGMQPGTVWVDCSTVNPSFSHFSADAAGKAGVEFLDAPVVGTRPQAGQAALVFLVGGDPAVLEKVSGALKVMGQRILHMGPNGMGSSFKILLNSMLAQSVLAFAETLHLGEAMGLDKTWLLQNLPEFPVVAPVVRGKIANFSEEDYEPFFPLELMLKDLGLVTETALERGSAVPLANAAKEAYALANEQGLGRLDFSAVNEVLKRKVK